MKKIIFSFILGILISSVAYAAVSLSSDKVSYKDTTVKDSLDNLFDESVNGKNSIIAALSNKGFNVTNDSTYTDIVNGINELPITLAKDDNGNYGYLKDGNYTSFDNIEYYQKEVTISRWVETVVPITECDLTKGKWIVVFAGTSNNLNDGLDGYYPSYMIIENNEVTMTYINSYTIFEYNGDSSFNYQECWSGTDYWIYRIRISKIG